MGYRACSFVTFAILVSACIGDDDGLGGTLDAVTDQGLDLGASDTTVAPTDTLADTTVAPLDTTATTLADTTVAPLDTTDTTPVAPVDTTVAPVDTTVVDTTTADTSSTVPDPGLAGPLDVTRAERELAGFGVDLYVPEGPGPFPLVFLSPGFLLEGKSFVASGEHLASHGFVVAIPTWGDSIFAPIAHATLADHVTAILDALLAPGASPAIDPARVGVAGHSRGGKITLLAATRDARIRAAFGFDPVDSVGPLGQPSPENPSVTPELMGSFTIPLGVVGSAKGGTPYLGATCAPPADNYHQYFTAAASAAKYAWVAPGSGHNDFGTDLGFVALACEAGDDPVATRTFAHRRATAFFEVHLDGDARYAPWLQ